MKSSNEDGAKGLCYSVLVTGQPSTWEELMNKTKPYAISKKVVYDAFLKVKQNKGSAGIDEESIDEFEKNLKDNLYKLWNRMSSGTYFPPPVRETELVPRVVREEAIWKIQTAFALPPPSSVRVPVIPSVEVDL